MNTPTLPPYVDFGIMMWNDSRLYRVRVSPPKQYTNSAYQLPLQIVQMANLVVNLTTREFIKNRWPDPAGSHLISETLAAMFNSVDITDFIAIPRS